MAGSFATFVDLTLG